MRLSAVDRDALARALELAKTSDEPARREQIERMLKEDGWSETAQFAAYGCQTRASGLKPWQCPPCHAGMVTGRGRDYCEQP